MESRSLFVLALLAMAPSCDPDTGSPASERQPLTLATLTKAVKIADPHRTRFPADTTFSCFARSIWDMHTFEGRIFLGGGDLDSNSGPTEVWSVADDGTNTDLLLEIVVDEEQVALFREDGGTLLIPGLDGTESWDYGNFYLKRRGAWQKRRTIPGALHVMDVASFQGKLYSSIQGYSAPGVLESADGGASWQLLTHKRQLGGMLVPLDSAMLVIGPQDYWRFQGGKFHPLRTRAPNLHLPRATRLGTGVLLSAPLWSLPAVGASPLVYLQLDGTAMVMNDIGTELSAAVRDHLVEGNTTYVLLARTTLGGYLGLIYSATDLNSSNPAGPLWTKVAEFTVPAPPYSFAHLGGRFYVGLGAEGMPAQDPTPEPASGTVWRLE